MLAFDTTILNEECEQAAKLRMQCVLLFAVVLFIHICSLSSLVVLAFEMPVSCTFIVNHARPITEFAERRTCFEKAVVYVV